MKTKLLCFTLALLALGGSLSAQKITGSPGTLVGGDMNASSAACATARSCVWVTLSPNASSLSVTLSGTWSATVLAEQSADGGTTWTTVAASLANGLTTYTVTSMTDFRVRVSAYTSGIASVTLSVGLLQVQSVVSGSSSSSPSSPSGDLRSTFNWSEDFLGQMPQTQALPAAITIGGTGSAQIASSNSVTATITISAGQTVFVQLCDTVGRYPMTVIDTGANIYTQIVNQYIATGSSVCQIFATAPGSTAAATSVTGQSFGAAQSMSIAAVSYNNVRSFGLSALSQSAAGTTAAVSGTILSEDANDFFVSFYSWFNGVATLTATTGTQRTNLASASGSSEPGIAIFDSTAAGIGASLSTAGTLSVSTNYSAYSIELRSTNGMGSTLGVGSTGWAISGASNTSQLLPQTSSLGASGMMGVLELQSAAPPFASNAKFSNWAETFWPSSRNGQFAVNNSLFDVIFRVRIPAGHLTNTAVFCGLSDLNGVGEASYSYVGIGFNTATDTDWMAVTQVVTGANRVDLGLPADNSPIDLRMRSSTAGTVLYSLWRNGAMVSTSEVAVTNQIPTAILAPYCSVTPQSNAARFFDIDFSQGVVQVIR